MNNYRVVLKDIQNDTLRILLVAMIVAATAGLFMTRRGELVRVLFALIFMGVAVIAAQGKYVSLPNHALVYGLWLLNVLALHLELSPLVPYLFVIIVLIAAHAVNRLSAGFVALASSLALVSHPLDQGVFHGLLLLIWGSYAISLNFARGLHLALKMILDYQAYAVAQMDEARERRAEVVRTARALNNAMESLHHANVQLHLAHDAAQEARRLKAQFAANVSHELRTPINLIVGFSEMIALAPEAYRVQLPPAYRPDILTVYRNAKHLQNLINDILDMSQVEAEHLSMVKEEIDPAQVIREAANLVRESIENKGLRFVMDMPDQLPVMWLDRTRVRQVILNLLANAARFTDEGTICLRVRLEDADLCISVIDTGIGISADKLEHVFEEFFQIDANTPRQLEGTGLGLTLSKTFVQQHGGRMWAESEGIAGKGSTFSFTLPLTNNVYQNPQMGSLSIKTDRPAILVCDEDPAIVQLFKGYSRNHPVTGCHSAEECLRLVETLRPAAVVLSQEGAAEALAERIHGVEPNTMVLLCPMPSGKRAMLAQGAADYLVKPISREGLLHALHSLGESIRDVLIIDDDPDLVRLFSRILQTAPTPYEIRFAYNGQEGLKLMHSQRPDVVLLDILMPDIDGFAIIQHIHADAALQAVPVVVVSARGAEEAITPRTQGKITVIRPAGFSPIELVNGVEALVTSQYPLAQQV